MVLQEGAPSLRRRFAAAQHIFADTALSDVDAQFEQFAVDARCTPTGILPLKRLALPVSYWRSAEFGYAWRQIQAPAGARVLDLGSPKDLAAMFARHRGYEVVATDILPDAVEASRRYARAQRLDGRGAGCVQSETQDG